MFREWTQYEQIGESAWLNMVLFLCCNLKSYWNDRNSLPSIDFEL